jgi:5'-nucleotidase
MKRVGVAAAVALSAFLAAVPPTAFGANEKDKTTSVQLLAINDFHGNLQPPAGSGGILPNPDTGAATQVGGVEYLGTHMKALRATEPNTITVGAGDLIGASPLISGLFHDEPTIEAMNALGLDVTGVGNHEFDEGRAELLRMQNGGCHPVDGCQDGDPFSGAFFQYLSSNVFLENTDETLFPPYEIRRVGKSNVKVAFLGLTLEGTPLIVTPSGVAGLEFRDEIETINALVAKLRLEQGVRAFVVLIHEGGLQTAPFAGGFMNVNRCDNFTGAIEPIVDGLSPDVDVVVSAHTHQPYVCNLGRNGILTTSASSFGRLITDIDLVIDNRSKDVEAARAVNHLVTRNVAKDPAETAIVDKYNAIAAPIANRIVGQNTATLDRAVAPGGSGETALGDVIADAQLASTAPTDFGGAVVAFMNPGGIRADLPFASSEAGEGDGNVTYGELFSVQPFGNTMVVKTMTGDMIYRLLEQQQFGSPGGVPVRILQVSDGFTYSYDSSRPAGSRVIDGSVKIDGVPVDKAAPYRVAMNNFLADGGDGFSVFREGTDQLGGAVDLDALVNYFMANSPVAPGPKNRITRLG